MIAWCQSLLRKWGALVGRRGVVAAAPAPQEDPDAEIREVFLAELIEVTKALKSAHADWCARPHDADALKRLRRGFHTLKGSAPLVGATALADCCRQLELLVARFAEKPATPDRVRVIEYAIQLLPACAEAIRVARPLPPQLRAIGVQVQRYLA
ncbi:MAG TPA: Hpt domain-containing protein [Patescibacteria group bacterium]|nr:Hpt domain-containing protein [Patescibacteria group bacterium]